MVLFHAILKSRQNQTICRRWQIYYIIMIPSRRFTVSQEETSCMYMPLLHQVMKWNTFCTQLLIHFPALSAAAAIQSYHVLKILKDYGYRILHKRQWTISDPLPFTLHTLYSIILIMTVFTTKTSWYLLAVNMNDLNVIFFSLAPFTRTIYNDNRLERVRDITQRILCSVTKLDLYQIPGHSIIAGWYYLRFDTLILSQVDALFSFTW